MDYSYVSPVCPFKATSCGCRYVSYFIILQCFPSFGRTILPLTSLKRPDRMWFFHTYILVVGAFDVVAPPFTNVWWKLVHIFYLQRKYKIVLGFLYEFLTSIINTVVKFVWSTAVVGSTIIIIKYEIWLKISTQATANIKNFQEDHEAISTATNFV